MKSAFDGWARATSGGMVKATSGSHMLSGLRRRLLFMLIVPLILLALLNAWFDYRSADNVAQQQDQRLLTLLPLLADSVIAISGSIEPSVQISSVKRS